VITALTPPCNDDGRLVAADSGTDNTGAEVEGAAVVPTSDIAVADRTGACDAGTVTSAATAATVVVGAASAAGVATVVVGAASAAGVASAAGAASTVGAANAADPTDVANAA
jgi:hypothetical protein